MLHPSAATPAGPDQTRGRRVRAVVPVVACSVSDIRITVAAQEPGASYRIAHVGEVGRRDRGVFRRAYSMADVEAMRITFEDEVVFEDGDETFKEILTNPVA